MECVCLSKDAGPDALVYTVRTIAQGGQPISEAQLRPGLMSQVLNGFTAFQEDLMERFKALLGPKTD